MKKILFAALFALLGGSVLANPLYILFEPSCMDRLEYVDGDNANPYIVYHINLNPAEKIILEIGVEDKALQPTLPPQVMRCGDSFFDGRLIDDINRRVRQVFFVVRLRENTHLISPVIKAARYMRAEDEIIYSSRDYSFRFDRKMGYINENIAYQSPPQTEVFFRGRLENDCSGAYLFRQISEGAARPHTDLVLIPELGISEVRSGFNADDALRNAFRLDKVNGKPVGEYLRLLCQGLAEAPVSIYGNQAAGRDDFITVGATGHQQPTPASPALDVRGGQTTPPPSPPPAAAETHTVQKGETLYRISKRYGATVPQLQQWNDKGNSTTIYPGEKLRVSAGQAAAGSGAAASASLAARSAAEPTFYGQTTRPTVSTHVVRSGETMASIALRYGYTEARFRQFNNMNPIDVPRIGQTLRVSDCDCPPSTAESGLPTTSLTPFPRDPTPRSPSAAVTEYAAPAERPGTGTLSNDRSGTDDWRRYSNTPYFVDRPALPPSSGAASPAYDEGSRPDGRQLQPRAVNINQPLPPDGYNDPYQPRAPRNERTFYVVQDGDSLYGIGRRYGLTVEQLRAINDLGANEVIIPGQKLFVR